MFQSLRNNNPVYIFHKGNKPYLEIGYIASISSPRPKYPVPANFTQPQEMLIDLSVKINEQIVNYNGLPAQSNVADTTLNGDSIVITDSKETMNAEILSLKHKSEDIIKSIDFHKEFIVNCDKALTDLNPEFAEKQAQKIEISELKQQVTDISKSIIDLMESNKRLIEQLNNK